MKYKITEDSQIWPMIITESSEYSPNQYVFHNDEIGIWLYHANCMEFMDILISRYPNGKFDMIFTDHPPIFFQMVASLVMQGRWLRLTKDNGINQRELK